MRLQFPSSLAITLAALLLAGCASTPQDRIGQNRAMFESFPADVQRKVSAGEVDVGFTEEMVVLALGKAGRKFTRADASGESQVWVYYKSQPRFGFGFGMSSGGYGGVSSGVAVSTAGNPDDEFQRVVFQDGRVTAVEKITR
jgi:ABC-type Fe3+-hydroxamate transport system substrate-binding protein